LIVFGIAGCSKTTLYLALASRFPCAVVVPSNELKDDVVQRANVFGFDIVAYTQHEVFEMDLTGRILLIDEIFLFPEFHVRAIAALADRVIGFGDPAQTHDLGFGQNFQARFAPQADENQVELPVSFTVPQDVMRYAKSMGWIPHHWSSLSPVQNSMEWVHRHANFNIPTITFSRECKVGFVQNSQLSYTVVTAQGARIPRVVVHLCDRDLGVLSPAGTFASGDNMLPMIWTAFSRHTEKLYLDVSAIAANTFAFPHLPFSPDNEDISYIPPGAVPQGVFISPSIPTTIEKCPPSPTSSTSLPAPSGIISASMPELPPWPQLSPETTGLSLPSQPPPPPFM
jgi:hypothetical protein